MFLLGKEDKAAGTGGMGISEEPSYVTGGRGTPWLGASCYI